MNQALSKELKPTKNLTVSHGGCGSEEGLISVDQALQMLLDHTQSLDIDQTLNRYLAKAVYSKINLPLFSQSAVDGYAICAAPATLGMGTSFELIGEIRAGQNLEIQLQQGQAIRIFTGAKIPANTSTVARQEIVQLLDNGETRKIVLTEPLQSHADIRDVGEEVACGQLLADLGQKLSVGAIATLSMAGVKNIEVFKYPKIAVVITGDEVSENVEDLASGKIFDANSSMVSISKPRGRYHACCRYRASRNSIVESIEK